MAVDDVGNDVSHYRQRLVGSLLVLLDNSVVFTSTNLTMYYDV